MSTEHILAKHRRDGTDAEQAVHFFLCRCPVSAVQNPQPEDAL